MSVLVTGGAGYIGSHTVRLLVDRGEDVVVLDTLEFGHRQAVRDVPLQIGDIGDAALVGRVIDDYGVNSVIHFAGYKAAGESMERPGRYFDNNVVRSARSSMLYNTREYTASCSRRRARCTAHPVSCRSTNSTRPRPRVLTVKAN